MIFTSCPGESDPKDHVADFVSKKGIMSMSGFRLDGLDYLKKVVLDEISRTEPSTRIIELDRDYISDNGIDFVRDLRKKLQEEVSEGKVCFVVVQDVSVMDWQAALDVLQGKDAQVYFFTTACRQVPCCFKLINAHRDPNALRNIFQSPWRSRSPRAQYHDTGPSSNCCIIAEAPDISLYIRSRR